MNAPKYDLLICNGQIITADSTRESDIAVKDGKIVALAPELAGRASRTIDARGMQVFPGIIDAHTHMGIPIMGTYSCDDFESGSVAAACGGVTTIIDFTVQEPGQTLQESVDVRLEKARGKSHVDCALHVNVTDEPNKCLAEIPKLTKQGLKAFKVFSTYRQAGMMIPWPEFRRVLHAVHENDGILCLHAEDNELVETLTDEHITAGKFAPVYHARSRTAEAEARAIARAAEIARELGASLYIVHLSSAAGLEAALQARAKGARLYLETCPQYLVLSEKIYEREDGRYWITTPPLRTPKDCDALWQALADGVIDVVATDHCPFTIAQKDAGHGQFHQTPNGIPGVETLFPLLYTHGVAEGRSSLQRLTELLAENPARIFGLAGRKGAIQIGADADFAIWQPGRAGVIRAENLHGRPDWSPYEGFRIAGSLAYTILRGQILYDGGEFTGDNVFGRHLAQPET